MALAAASPSSYSNMMVLLIVAATLLATTSLTTISTSDAFTPPLLRHHSLQSTQLIHKIAKSKLIGGGSSTNIIALSSSSSSRDDNDSTEEIFYDDFAEVSIIGDASYQEELPDFDDDDDDIKDNNRNDDGGVKKEDLISIPLPKTTTSSSENYNNYIDITGGTYREFTLGRDLLLSDYAGSLGYDQVTDWQYYTADILTGEKLSNTIPNPFDPNQPSRTRSKSGSIVRIFRGEFTGKLGGMLRSRGLDTRVLLKEFACDDDNDNGDDSILQLANDEKKSLGKLQSSWLRGYCISNNNANQILEQLENGEWTDAARKRYVDGLTDTDDEHLVTLLECLSSKKGAPFTSILGEMNLNDYYDDEDVDPNEWYRTLGVKPPKPGSIWIVYDYHGLSTAASYAVPLMIQRSKLPPKRGMFGRIVEAPPLPPFKERGRYMIRGVLKGMLQAIATAHAADLVHRSIGKNSFILSSVGQDKREATSPYAVVVERLRVVLTDWGFSRDIREAVVEKEFAGRCRMFDIPTLDSYEYQRAMDTSRMEEAAAQFAKAEDLHACGFVFLSMLFTTLADPATLSAPLPATDDDTLQRLFSEIFEKDIDELREYYANEDVWSEVVSLLDMEERAGWELLGKMLLAREQVSDWYKSDEDGVELTSAESLLSHPFFSMKII
jgi:serine/threonine protein kinase